MIKTKLLNRNNYYVVQKADEFDKYKQIASFNNKLDAQVFRKKLIENTNKAIASVNNITVVDAYKKYADFKFDLWNKYDQLSEHQGRIYLRHLKRITENFPKNKLLRDLISKDLVQLFKNLRASEHSYKTSSLICYSFKGMVEWCVDQDLIREEDYNIRFFEVSKYPELKPNDGSDKSKKTVMINRYEVNRLREAIKPTDRTDYNQNINAVAVSIFIYTGARPSEVRAIEWSGVNTDTNRIHIRQQMDEQRVKRKLKAEGSERILFIPTRLRIILERWKAFQAKRVPNPRFVLQNVLTGLPVTDKQLRNFIYRAYAKIGLAKIEDVHNHVKVISCKFKREPFKTFRHFVSTALLDAQAANPAASDNFIKTQLGHRDIKTTRMIYGDHNDLDHQSNKDKSYVSALDNALELVGNEDD